MHVFECIFRVLSLQLIKSTFYGFQGLFGIRLVAFISCAVQIGYRTVQLLQSSAHVLTFVSAQHAAVLLQGFDRGPDFHGRIVYSVKVLGLNRRFHVFYQLLDAGPRGLG